MDFIVGAFNQETLYTLSFQPSPSPSSNTPSTLSIIRPNPAIAGHSWLSLSATQSHLYATCWNKSNPSKASVAAYKIKNAGRDIQYLNAKPVQNLSGYVCVSKTHLYSVGGATGEVFLLEADGSIGDLVQTLNFVDTAAPNMSEQRGSVPHGDFGGLRHGAHSCDLSPDGKALYVADIGRNCIWTYSVAGDRNAEPNLTLRGKEVASRPHDGPRHTWPHPNGRVLYSLQEHSSMVDLYAVGEDGVGLERGQGVKIIPEREDCGEYWADEVRLSTGPDPLKPRYMYASTRGLKKERKGWVAVFELREDGTLASEKALDIWETPTSGGIANAIEPAPYDKAHGGIEYLAMTDSEEGWVFILSFDGKTIQEVSRLNLGKTEDGEVVKAATPVWLINKKGKLYTPGFA